MELDLLGFKPCLVHFPCDLDNHFTFLGLSCSLQNGGVFLFLLFFVIFIYFWLLWVFVAACRLSLVAASGDYSLLRCAGFSLRWLLPLWSTGSRHVGSVVVARGLSSCGSRA